MQGQLFTQDFLQRGVLETPAWQALGDESLAAFEQGLAAIFAGRDIASVLNEAQTESEIIAPILALLGWGDASLPQVNLSVKRREDVPDWLLFADAARKAEALAETKDDRRYRHGLALLEAKRWTRPLDRGDATDLADPDTPSSQMLRYLSRADVVGERAVKWGVLTNGSVWRLYWQDARSRSEEFFEIPLARALGLPGFQRELDDPPPAHLLRLFALFFGRAAFLPQEWDAAGRTLHAYALNEARLYEERVSQDLGARVFGEVFPQLADALARGDLQQRTHTVGYGVYTRPQFDEVYLDEVREATLVLLYRLLFLFYAEDRRLLPVHDARYQDYSVRRIREEVRDKMDAGAKWSSTVGRIWLDLQGAFRLIDEGDDGIGVPAYNGGLFKRARAPLLERSTVPDKVMAPIIDALSRRTEEVLKGWINYRDLSVSHLGGIYERLLEYKLVHEVQAQDDYRDKPEIDRVAARPASFARKVSGSYYTHHDLVRLVLRESVGRLAAERMAAFEKALDGWKSRASLTPPLWDKLDGTPGAGQRDAIDPATQILELTICDPAMGSGHFLVTLVDDLADRVLEAASRASDLVNAQPWAAHLAERGRAWESPIASRIAAIRREIRAQASAHGWAVTDEQLDDRHIVRRMVLKKCVFGVDKNAMAVELAKTSLWLHTFTVGAPLSFLDHHLKCGDSLHGEPLGPVRRGLAALGTLFDAGAIDRLALAAQGLAQVADLTDVDIAEARQSAALAEEAEARTAPLHRLLDFWRALRWLLPGWPVDKPTKLAKLGDEATRAALAALLAPGRNLVETLSAGRLEQREPGAAEAADLMRACAELARRERFFHWWTQFPTVFDVNGAGGFDVVLGNPPWDRIKLQEVEWFAERDAAIATQPRAADRKAQIAALQKANAPLAVEYAEAVQRAEANARVLAKAGDYPLLGGGDVNLYSLFVERAQTLAKPGGLVALLTPSGIAADKGAAAFFSGIATHGRLGALYDFENRKVFFPDVHASFKFCTLVFGGPERRFDQTLCAFFLHSLDELEAREATGEVLVLSAHDFALVNPNTGAAPIFRTRRDADITTRIYRQHPVLVRHAADGEQRAWPVKYARMFDMTNDSGKFMKPGELQQHGWQRAPLNRWRKGGEEALPLYEGKMVQMFDHRAADVVVNTANLKRAAQQASVGSSEKESPERYPTAQYWVAKSDVSTTWGGTWCIAYKSVTAPSNMRTMIAALIPASGVGNSMAMLLPSDDGLGSYATTAPLLLANICSLAYDFVLRQKVQGQNLNWFIIEQTAVISASRFNDPLPAAFTTAARAAGLMNGHHAEPSIADFVAPQVLALSYTAHDLAPFARDMGYVDARGMVLPPIAWNEEERRERLAALDALFFWLYGLSGAEVDYVLSTFPIVREQDERAFGRFRTLEDVQRWRALLPEFQAI
ncbi:Eco57I restriction-modification methylase domain-containing protein [Comamonas badia]|uniref:Eco57I restriction-modification methylase domain-containing protein n=1 Tax=Comamonas badia TaxID=265291 RepID=UPI00040204EA|nr:hypothetical protein [Comamonas badia]